MKWFNDKKGYGFITRNSGDDVFVHYTSVIAEGFRTLAEGDQVEFEVKQNQKGQAAVDVSRGREQGIAQRSSSGQGHHF